jgi:hypothetical protein
MRITSTTIPRMWRFCLFCALCICAIVIIPSAAYVSSPQGQSTKSKFVHASSDQPVWKVDLHSMGYPPENHLLQWQRGLGSFDTVDFLSDGVVAETFITQEPAASLQRRENANRARPYRLHAIFFDAASGIVLKTLEWLGDDLKMGIFPRYDGSFVFFSTEHLVLYSADWNPVKEVALLQLQEPSAELKEIAESPSGKVLDVRIRRGDSLLCLRIQTDTLTAERDSCSVLLPFAISDDGMASTLTPDAVRFSGENREAQPDAGRVNNEIKMKRTLMATVEFVGERGDFKKTLCDEPTVRSCGPPTFITNNLVVVYGNDEVGLLDISGITKGEKTKVEFQRDFGNNYMNRVQNRGGYNWIAYLGRPIRTSANGERFAVALNAPESPAYAAAAHALMPEELPAVDPSYVDVFDLPSARQKLLPDRQCYTDAHCDWWIYRLKNVKEQFKHIWGFGLSPNGEKLVIDSGGVVQVYTLPAATGKTVPTN